LFDFYATVSENLHFFPQFLLYHQCTRLTPQFLYGICKMQDIKQPVVDEILSDTGKRTIFRGDHCTVKNIKPIKSGTGKFRDEFDDYENTSYKSKAKKPKRIRRENFDDENDKLDDYDVYSY